MIYYNYIPDKDIEKEIKAQEALGRRIEEKWGWSCTKLTFAMRFIHATNTPPDVVRAFGLSPQYATEYLVEEVVGKDGKKERRQLGEGKMVFAFPEGTSGKATEVLWGGFRHRYIFTARAGMECYCQNGVVGPKCPNKEVAFPYVIEPGDIDWPLVMPKFRKLKVRSD